LEVIEIDLDKVTDAVDGGFPNVVIVSIGGTRVTDSRVSKILEFFRQTPSRPSVLIISNNDEDAEAMTALRLGSAGFFSSGDGITLLVAAINLVMAGGRYVPPGFINKLGTSELSRQS
jgi:DNA-binding NarL/FixJ family response regulator